MPDRPSIKGSVFRYHIEEILKRVSAGEVSRDELVRRLGPGDVAVLDTPILATQWYDVRTYERIVLLRRELEGDESEDCLRRYGAEAAERLMAAGLYKQINRYLDSVQAGSESDRRPRFEAFGRDLSRIMQLSANLLSFCRVEVKVDPDWPDRYVTEFSEASAYPDVLCWTTDGFMNRIASRRGEENLWRWRRPEPDRVVYWMTRGLCPPQDRRPGGFRSRRPPSH